MDYFSKILVLLFLLIFSISSFAQVSISNQISASTPHLIRVGLLVRPPFVNNDNGTPSGLVIDLWQLVAKNAHWKYKFSAQFHDLNESLKALKSHQIDILIGPIPVDFKDLQSAQFSRPFFINRVTLITNKHKISFFEAISYIFTKMINYKFLIFIVIFILFCHALWYFEWRRVRKESYVKGIGHALWFGFLSFFIWEAADPYPVVTLRGRILLMIWLLTSVITLAFITASITGALTVSLLSVHKEINFRDMRDRTIAYISGDVDIDDIVKLDINPIKVKSLQEGIKLLQNNEVAGVIVDLPYAKYYLKKSKLSHLVISNDTIDYDEYAFAFPLKSGFKQSFDLAFDKLKSTHHLTHICAKYVGMRDGKFCNL